MSRHFLEFLVVSRHFLEFLVFSRHFLEASRPFLQVSLHLRPSAVTCPSTPSLT
jgi:hypothetical protein